MTTIATITRAAASAIRYRRRLPPSQWIAENACVTAAATGSDGSFDVWHWPCNVGIVDAAAEGKRGVLAQKPVQMGLSHYFQALLCWEIETYGGPIGYSMAKDDTVREHVLDRLDAIFANAPGLRQTQLTGRDNHETILSKRFTNASVKFFGSGSVNNFISNPYRAFFCDEFERMGIFPDGSDAVELAKGRQSAFGFPRLFGWSTPLEAEAGISKYVELDSDQREFHIRCPHCHEPVTLDFFRDVEFAKHTQDNRPVPGSAVLRCQLCKHAITDSERATALTRAAQAACVWYTAVPYDDAVGWVSTMTPEDAATREYAGFGNWSHLHNPRMTLLEIAHRWCGIRTEAQKKVFYNDVLGKPYTIMAQVVDAQMLRSRVAAGTRQAVPEGTLWVTLGSDVQGGGVTGDLVFYFDISAWVPGAHGVKKVCLEVDRLKGLYTSQFAEMRQLIAQWRGKDDSGHEYRISTACVDAGWRTEDVYKLCNSLCTGRAQWVVPVIYNHEKLGAETTRWEPQGAGVGDPSRRILLTSRDYAVGRAIDRLTGTDLVELPCPLKPELERHYLSNIQIEDYDRHGNKRGMHWVKKQLAKGHREDDDWLQAAAYCELAAVQLGLDTQGGAVVVAARAAADQHQARKEAKSTRTRPDDWIERSRRLVRGRHGFQRV